MSPLQPKENTARADSNLSNTDFSSAFVGLLQGFKVPRRDAVVLSQHNHTILGLINRKKEPLRETGLKRLANICRHDGVDDRGISTVLQLLEQRKLNTSDLATIDTLTKKGPKHANIAMRVLHAVSATSAGREREALQRLSHHNGSFTVLEKYLVAMSTDDLFKAAKRSQILMASDQIIREHPEEFKVDIVEGEQIPDRVTTASGQHATSAKIFFIQDMLPPGLGIACGEMATTHLTETLRGEAPEGKALEKKKAERKRRAHEQFEHITLEDLLADPSILQHIKSPLIGRKLRVFKELETEVVRLRNEIEELLDDQALTRISSLLNRLQLQDDPSGMLDSYLRIQAKEGKMPDAIELAYNNINHPVTELQPDEEAYMRRALLLYQVHHSFIAEHISVKPFLDDLAVWEALPAEDPLKEKFAKQFSAIKPKLAAYSQQQVISLQQFGELLNTAGLFEFRSAINQRVWQTFAEEVRNTVIRFNRLLFRTKTGAWREDCITLSVPERTRNSFYGARIGVDNPDKANDPNAKRATVSSEELRHIMFMSVNLDACPDDRRILRATPIQDFTNRINAVVSAGRKADYLDMTWHRYQRSQAGKGIATTEDFDPENISTGIKDWSPVLVLGPKLPGEELKHLVGLSAKELVERATSRTDLLPGTLRLQWKKHQERLSREASVNLYSDGHDKDLLLQIAKHVANLTPATELGQAIEKAKEMGQCPLVYKLAGHYRPEEWVALNFFTNSEANDIRRAASGYERFIELGLSDRKQTELLSNSAKRYQTSSFYVGKRQNDTISLAKVPFEEIFGKNQEESELFTYRPPKALAAGLDKLDKLVKTGKWVNTADAASVDWLEQVKKVCSRHGSPLLAAHGLCGVDTETFKNAQTLTSSKQVFLNKEFIDLIDRIILPGPSNVDLPVRNHTGNSILDRQNEFGVTSNTVVINFGHKHKGHSAIQVAITSPSYLSNFVQKGAFSSATKEIAMEAVNIVERVRRSKRGKRTFSPDEIVKMNNRLIDFVKGQ